MLDAYKYLIVGAGTAGHFTADSIRKLDPDGSIAIFGDEPYRPYTRPPLSKAVLTGKMAPEATFLKKQDDYYTGINVDLVTDAHVADLNPGAGKVTLADGTSVKYEKLLLATGGSPFRFDLPGSDYPEIMTLRSLDDSKSVMAATKTARRAISIGAGYIAAEVASSLAGLGIDSTMMIRRKYILERNMPNEFSEFLRQKAHAHGVNIVTGEQPEAFEGNGGLKGIRTIAGNFYEADMIVLGVGLKLNVELAENAGLKMSDIGGVETDEYMRTSDPNVWAAGDIACYYDLNFRRHMRVERVDMARRQGKTVAAGMCGSAEPYKQLPYYTFHMFGIVVKVVGEFNPDDVMRLGSTKEESISYYSFRDDIFEGYLNYGRPVAEQKSAKQIIPERLTRSQLLERLKEEGLTPESV